MSIQREPNGNNLAQLDHRLSNPKLGASGRISADFAAEIARRPGHDFSALFGARSVQVNPGRSL